MTDTPTNAKGVRTGHYTVQLSWTAPASNTPPVAGYEVFHVESGNDVTQSGGTTTDTTINVTLPTLGVTYDLFVVAFSNAPNTLPSPRSSNSTINLSKCNYWCISAMILIISH